MHRAMSWRKTAAIKFAGLAGATLRVGLKTFPGAIGAMAVTGAAGMVSLKLGLLVGGAFLLILDHRSSG